MARALFVGGVLSGQLIDVGEPSPAELRAEAVAEHVLTLPARVAAARDLEAMYQRHDLAVVVDGHPREFVVYLAPPEVAGMHDPELLPHLVRHVVMHLVNVGLVPHPDAVKGPA